jgi:dienelactone hydrolase
LVVGWALVIGLAGVVAACGGRSAARLTGHADVPATATTIAALPANTVRPVQPPSSITPVPLDPPYRVQRVTVRLVDPGRPTVSRGHLLSPVRTLTTAVWLPTAPGRQPLVVFGHGFDVGPDTYGALLDAWAAHGYVVAAPEFPLADPAVAGGNLDEGDINNQPADLRFVTDALTAAASPVSAHIDPTRIAVAGHSDGGESALAASVVPPPAGEARYRALIAMSVQPLLGSGRTANPPTLVTQGDADTINPLTYGIQTWQQAADQKYLLVLRGGGHLPPLQAGSAWLPGVEAVTEVFLDAYVAGDTPAAGVAKAAAVSAPGLFSFQSG